jgi:hypothetical protein
MRSRCCLCNPPVVARQQLGKNPLIVARQRAGRNVTTVTNIHETIELLGASFSMWPVPYQGKYAIGSSQNFLFFKRNSCNTDVVFIRKYHQLLCELLTSPVFSCIPLHPCMLSNAISMPRFNAISHARTSQIISRISYFVYNISLHRSIPKYYQYS